jgi:hypothetical protein
VANKYFNNVGGDGKWSNAANWLYGKPGPTDGAVISGAYYNGPITIDENVNVLTIQFTGTGVNPFTSTVTKLPGFSVTASGTLGIRFAYLFTGTLNMTDGVWTTPTWEVGSTFTQTPFPGTINPGTSKVITKDIKLDDENYISFYDLEIGTNGQTWVSSTVHPRQITVTHEMVIKAGVMFGLSSTELIINGDFKIEAGGELRGLAYYHHSRLIILEGATISQMDGHVNLQWDGLNGDAEIIFLGNHVDDIEPGEYGAEHIAFEHGIGGTPNKTIKLKAGTWTFKNRIDPSYVGGIHPHLEIRNGGATTQYTVDMTNNPDIVCVGAIEINEDTGSILYLKGTGDITLGGFGTPGPFIPDTVITYDLGGKNVEKITVNETYHGHIHRLTGEAKCTAFDLVDGKFDFNGETISTDADFDIAYPAEVYVNGLAGSVINVGNNCHLDGDSGGPTLLDLKGLADWFLNVVGAGAATYVDVAYSDASGGSTIYADINSVNSGHLDNWSFVLPTWDNPLYGGNPSYLIDSEEVKSAAPSGVNPGRCSWNDVPLPAITRGVRYQCRVRQLQNIAGGVYLHVARVTEQTAGRHPFVRLGGIGASSIELEVGVMDDSLAVIGSVKQTISKPLSWAADAKLTMTLRNGDITGRVKATNGETYEKTYGWTSSGNYVRFAFSVTADNRLDNIRCLAVGGT